MRGIVGAISLCDVIELEREITDRAPYRHFMLKKIHEQPRAIADTIASLTPEFESEIFGEGARKAFTEITRVGIVACGTSYNAGLIARHWIENLADVPCDVDMASEYRHRTGFLPSKGLLLVLISQSGETADTLGALKHARNRGVRYVLSICNVAESSLTQLSDLHFMTQADPEIGVASTQAFTTQLVALYALAVSLALARGDIDVRLARKCHARLTCLPKWSADILRMEPALIDLATCFNADRNALLMGRGLLYPVVMEGALQLKEISCIHAEAYAAGELKHGPLALVNSKMPVVALVPNDALVDKMKSDIQEVRARGGKLLAFADKASMMNGRGLDQVIVLPGGYGDLSPVPYAIALQLLAYHVAVLRENDVEKPRNLAESVTEE